MNQHRRSADVRRLASLPAAALLFAMPLGGGVEAAGRDVGPRPAGQFDYYVLSLSSVPGFCATHSGQPAECANGSGFALHGLWPQLKGGAYPTDCEAVTLSQSEIQSYRGLYASPSLIVHEWLKHGTCSGLQPAAYFALASHDLHLVRVPARYEAAAVLMAADAAAVKSAFIASNPGLSLAGLTAVINQGVLTEIDICLSKAGSYQAC